jgi:hypothetical protein
MSKYSEASRKRWEKVTPEERSRRMRAIAFSKWRSMDPEEKRKHVERMNKARLSK